MNPLKQYDMGNVNTAEESAKTFMASVYIVPKSFFKYLLFWGVNLTCSKTSFNKEQLTWNAKNTNIAIS